MVILEGKYGMMEIPQINKKLMAYNLLSLTLSHDNTSTMKLQQVALVTLQLMEVFNLWVDSEAEEESKVRYLLAITGY